jgi:hypothetical protein
LDGTGAPFIDCAAAELSSSTMLPSDFTSYPLFEGCFSYLSGLFGFCMLSSLASVVSCCCFHFFSTCVLFLDSMGFLSVILGFPSFVDEHGSSAEWPLNNEDFPPHLQGWSMVLMIMLFFPFLYQRSITC